VHEVDATAAPALQSRQSRQSRIFEIPIELDEPREMLERITSWVGADGPTKRVTYVNAHVLNQSREDAELRATFDEADLIYCDGYGVRLAAKAIRTEIPHRMTGADWVWDLAAMCEQRNISLYLLGCEPAVAAQAGQRLLRAHPGLRIVGTHHGYFEVGSAHDERVIEDINACQPDILLVGMGTPKQELWAQRTVGRLECSVLWNVGALFDYVSGHVPRAPASLADNGLEWMFRLAIEPKRMWRRYLVGNPVFLSRVIAQARQRYGADA